MSEHRETSDGLTEAQVDDAYEVLEVLRDKLEEAGLSEKAAFVNETHYELQQYDEGADWHTVQEVEG